MTTRSLQTHMILSKINIIMAKLFLQARFTDINTEDYLQFTRQDILKQKNIPVYTYKVVRSYPHHIASYTQGLVVNDGFLYEGIGLHRHSKVLKQDLETGKILSEIAISSRYFGEGIAILDNKLYQLTYKSNTGFVYDKTSLKLTEVFHYPSQGWGLTTNGKELIMSDGSSALHFIDPKTFKETKLLFVKASNTNVGFLNELQYINGKIYANVWQSNFIAVISPKTGRVIAWIDLTGLNPEPRILKFPSVLNGIAYDEEKKSILVTGKNWPILYAIEIIRE